ncbi:unnamed protein product [marine sediment metagenome]|uniref:Uncharacterized protein n=1 Tax=marine sediment metagenome TaxID=412755 RepID=X0ZMD9_9ZZZZ
MKTKDEILDRCRADIQNPKYSEQAPFWLEYRKIEVLIDIRDILVGIDRNFGSNIFDLARES